MAATESPLSELSANISVPLTADTSTVATKRAPRAPAKKKERADDSTEKLEAPSGKHKRKETKRSDENGSAPASSAPKRRASVRKTMMRPSCACCGKVLPRPNNTSAFASKVEDSCPAGATVDESPIEQVDVPPPTPLATEPIMNTSEGTVEVSMVGSNLQAPSSLAGEHDGTCNNELLSGSSPSLAAIPASPKATPASKVLVKCSGCERTYHKRCYLRESGVDVDFTFAEGDDPLTATTMEADVRCTACLAGVIPDAALLKAADEERVMNDSEADRLAAALLQDGFCLVPLAKATKVQDATSVSNATEEVEEPSCAFAALRDQIVKYHAALMKTYEVELESGKSMPSMESGFANIRERGEGRYEITRTPFIESAMQAIIHDDPLIQAVLERVLHCGEASPGEDSRQPKQMSSGCFLSFPGAKNQVLHTDGPALSSTENLYPYAVNVFVPLVPVDKTNGTEFYPGTQLQRHADGSGPAPGSKPIEEAIVGREKTIPATTVGHALLFDYRVIHRGLGNRANGPRPNCYVTYAQPWYEDRFNFGSKRYATELKVHEHLLQSRSDRLASRKSQGDDFETS